MDNIDSDEDVDLGRRIDSDDKAHSPTVLLTPALQKQRDLSTARMFDIFCLKNAAARLLDRTTLLLLRVHAQLNASHQDTDLGLSLPAITVEVLAKVVEANALVKYNLAREHAKGSPTREQCMQSSLSLFRKGDQ